MAGTATDTPDHAQSAASDDGSDGFTVMGPEDTLAPVEPDPAPTPPEP